MDSRLLLTIDDAAELLSITPRRLSRLVKDGIVPSVDIGDGVTRFSPEVLRDWLRQLHGQVQEVQRA